MSMKDPLCPLTWVKAHFYSIQNGSDHKNESEPTRAGSFWKMWILQSWRGNTNNLQLPDLGEKKEAFPLSVPPSKTEPDLKLKLHSMQHQSGCKPITGLHTPTVWGVKGPPTCQVPLQGERGALVPTVAAAEEEPDQEGGQHQNQDPEEPGHSWVSDSPGCQDIHAEGR